MAFQTIRGTFDILPDAHSTGGSTVPGSPAWRHVETVVRGVMHRFAFEEIRTPILEPLDLVARGVGATTDIVSKEMFTVERTKETYVLRPEVTAPVMRAYLQHHLEQRGGAQRLFYVGPCFRAERPQKGRFRQFHQFGTELIGSDDARADAETIANLRAVYDAFGIADTRLRLNTLGDPADRPAFRDALRQYFEPHAADLSETSRQRLDTNPLRILDTKDARERALLADAPRLTDFVGAEAGDHYARVKALLDGLGVPYVEDPLLVRGLDYYTRTVFELEHGALGAQGALAAGGRYDGLAEDVGSKKRVPAVGYAAGIERLFIALEAQGYALPQAPSPDVFVVALGEAAESATFGIAQTLRKAGLAVDFALGGRSMKAQMKAADRSGARRAVVVGEDELAQGVAQLRDLEAGEQRPVPIAELAAVLARERAA
ncbi:histidine--tRNA ligase [Rubrivirga sp. IMCC43871]|uniref:histidine--tRNA ligase n=1 Tax=Rubrivirga sp. IMCC43871 TaxID=3391575 RepID=UPI00398FBBF8